MGNLVKARLVATVQIDLCVDTEEMEASANFVKRGDAYEITRDFVMNGKAMNELVKTLKKEFESANGDGFNACVRADKTYADVWIVPKGELN